MITDKKKQEYLKANGYNKVDEMDMRKELKGKNYSEESIQEKIKKYKYYKIMPSGKKMYYSEEFLNSHTAEELEKEWKKELKSEHTTPTIEELITYDDLGISDVVWALVNEVCELKLQIKKLSNFSCSH